jgi:hypothetical protein
MALRPEEQACDRSSAAILGSNPTKDMDARLLCLLFCVV